MHTLKLPPKEELTAMFLPGRKATEETPASLYERLNIKVRTNHTFILYLSLINMNQPVRLINDGGQKIMSSSRPMIPKFQCNKTT